MEQVSYQASGMQRDSESAGFTPLDREDRPTVNTAAAAHYLNRRPQTLRQWASKDHGPLRPLRVNGRLAWPVAAIRKLIGVAL